MSRLCAVIGIGVAATATLGLSGCGGTYRSEAPTRAPETCVGSEAVPACEQRLQRYEQDLQAMLPALEEGVQGDLVRPDGENAAQSPQPSVAQAYTESAAPAEEEESAPTGSRPPGPDCDAARDLRDRICELSDAICELAGRPGAEAKTVDSCKSASASCKRAREQVASACPN